jgi:NADH-quinone oxidoreductase subunit H
VNQLDTAIFFNDPWWIVAIKGVGVVILLLTWTIVNVWYERRLLGKMQNRIGPIMNGPFGLGQTLGDGLKFLLKEDFAPGMVDKVLYTLAPLIAGTCAFTAWAVIPLAGEVDIFGVHTRLQVTDLPVGALVILAASSVAIYGFVLAGWSSNSPYSLLGALRSSAQMISYEISMGLSFVAVFLYAGTMSTSDIVDGQAGALLGQPMLGGIGLQNWYWLVLFPSFVIYVISMVGETNRAPFDLPECESELVSGHLTEYTGFRYAIYYLAEYINVATVSAVCTTLFFGGYHAFWPFALIPGMDSGWWGLLWFIIKVQLGFSFFVWLRASLPRFRYDQFMDLGWKWMIPFSLLWLMGVATMRGLRNANMLSGLVIAGIGTIVILGLVAWTYLGGKEEEPPQVDAEAPFDAFAGGYPVPPMPGQTLPELASVVSSTTEAAATMTEDAVAAASGGEK